MKRIAIISLTVLATASCLAATTSPGEARQQAFKKILRSFEPMGLMVRGREPYDKNTFIQHADTLKRIANEPFTLFAPNTIDAKSRSKPEIWSQPAEFQKEKDAFLTAVNQLDEAARTKDLASIKKSFAAVSQTCKSCHDAFRSPER